eukprot:scaffold266433_cov35-Tisochrysis_lutea.AAC.4
MIPRERESWRKQPTSAAASRSVGNRSAQRQRTNRGFRRGDRTRARGRASPTRPTRRQARGRPRTTGGGGRRPSRDAVSSFTPRLPDGRLIASFRIICTTRLLLLLYYYYLGECAPTWRPHHPLYVTKLLEAGAEIDDIGGRYSACTRPTPVTVDANIVASAKCGFAVEACSQVEIAAHRIVELCGHPPSSKRAVPTRHTPDKSSYGVRLVQPERCLPMLPKGESAADRRIRPVAAGHPFGFAHAAHVGFSLLLYMRLVCSPGARPPRQHAELGLIAGCD